MEKYGVIPPRFTKAWWAYFWEYYKIHTIVGVSAVVLIGTSIVQCVRQPKYDLNILYVSGAGVTDDTQTAVQTSMQNAIDDITDDNKKLVFIQSIPIDSLESKDEQSYALVTKLSLELQTGEDWLFLASKDVAAGLSSGDGYVDCFMTIDELGIDVDDSLLLKSDNGKAYGIDISGNKLLTDSGLNTENMYLMVRRLYEREQKDDKNRNMYQNTLKAVKYITQ